MPSSKKIESTGIFLVMFVLFLFSVAFVIWSMAGKNKDLDKTAQGSLPSEKIEQDEQTSLSEYFKKNGSADAGFAQNEYIDTDPFREKCTGGGDGKTPYVVSGTVCYY